MISMLSIKARGVLTLRCDVRVDNQLVEVIGNLYILILPKCFIFLSTIKALSYVLREEVRPLSVDDLLRVGEALMMVTLKRKSLLLDLLSLISGKYLRSSTSLNTYD